VKVQIPAALKQLLPLIACASFQILGAQTPSNPIAQPERPWIHHYDQTLTMKVRVATKKPGGGTNLLLDLDHLMTVVKNIDQLTLGMPKILYLVGWQYDGHDSKYPAFFEVNPALKRPQDATALDSVKWFMREARQYHTTVSVHINMRDAYKNSPLWQEYSDHDLLNRGADGKLVQGGFWDGDQAYLVCYTKEWDAGFTQKRLDKLLALLPIADAGTIHIDAFHTDKCTAQGISREQETDTQKKIIRYLRDHGIDVTSEFFSDFRIDPLLGLQPMAWWFRRQELNDYLLRPASLLTGGVDETLGGKLFGTSMHGEDLIDKDPDRLTGFLREFCLQTVPWYYLNRHQRLRVELKPGVSEAHFSGDVETQVDAAGRVVMSERGRVLRDGDDILIPALWRTEPSLIAYSSAGYATRSWALPPDWAGASTVDIAEITPSGWHHVGSVPVVNGAVKLALKPDQGLLLTSSRVSNGK
jgi:hypothetical protein